MTDMTSYSMSIVGQGDCAAFVADHDLPVDGLFTDRWTLDQPDEAYRDFDRQHGGKAVFVFRRPLDPLRSIPEPQPSLEKQP